MKTGHVELLAPAGSFDSLQAAINAGCDSVYFGIADFNMRATAAKNFTLENLSQVVDICTKAGVKTYLTVNTLLYNDELDIMREIVGAAKKTGVTAIIAADFATIQYARSIGVEVQISTQVSISNIESLKFYSQFADRVVLARELSLEQMKEIYEDIKKCDIRGPKGELVELEVFAHGALCVAVSGRCAMSLYCYGPSANRGKCTQVCRRQYKVTDIETGKELIVDNNYIMSPADLCTIGMLPELVDAGAKVLKLEGRGRPPEYVDTVVRCYREALTAIEEGKYTQEKVKEWNERLRTVFNRGFSTGLYRGRTHDEWAQTHGSKATKEKTIIGKVQKYYGKIGVAQVKIKAKEEISEGEEFLITGPTTGAVTGIWKNIMVDDEVVKTAKQRDVVTFKVDSKVRRNDEVYVVRKRESLVPKGRKTD